jgi:hypothetical protein
MAALRREKRFDFNSLRFWVGNGMNLVDKNWNMNRFIPTLVPGNR